MSESDLVRNVLGALEARRVWSWRVNSGGALGGKMKLAPKGTPDIIGVLPGGNGTLFGLEAKVRREVQNPAQRLWEAKAQLAGVKYRVIRSVPEALAAIEEWCATSTRCARGGGGATERVNGVVR